jgi:hypothetical protein
MIHKDKDTHKVRVKGQKMIFQANGILKQGEVVTFISDRAGFKPKLVKGDKGHCILINGTVHQEDKVIINLYAPNIGALNFIEQTLVEQQDR